MERAVNATIGEWEQNLRAVEKWNWKTPPVWTRKRTKRQSFLFCFSKRFKTYQTIFPNFSKSNGPKTLIPQMEFTHWSGQSHSRVPLRIPFVVSVIYVYISLSAFTFAVSFTVAFAFAFVFVFVFSLLSLWHCRWASFVQWQLLLLLRLRPRLLGHYSASIAGRRPPSSRKAGSFALVATLAYAFVAGEHYSRIFITLYCFL